MLEALSQGTFNLNVYTGMDFTFINKNVEIIMIKSKVKTHYQI